MASISPTRLAAFEFLIQFRSAGRGQLTRAVRDIKKLTRASASQNVALERNQKITTNIADKARIYNRALLNLGRSAKNASINEAVFKNSLNNTNLAIIARNRLLDKQRLQQRKLRFNNDLRRFSSSRISSGISRVGGSGLASRYSIFRAKLAPNIDLARRSVFRLTRALQPLGVALSAITSILRLGAAGFGIWARANIYALGVVGLSVGGLAKIADSYTNLTNRIRVASDGTRTITALTDELLSSARRARSPVQSLIELYGRISINAKELGISQSEVLKFVELTGKTFRISGSGPREAQQSAIQLAQGIGSNRTSGEELRSILEQNQDFAQTLAKGLGLKLGDLKDFAEKGGLTARAVFNSILSQTDIVNKRFSRLEPTFSDSFTNMRSSLGLFFGSTLTSLKLAPRLFKFFDALSAKFQEVSKNSSSFSLAIRNLPRLFSALGLGGLRQVSDLLETISRILSNLPDRLLKFANNVNEFVGLTANGVDEEDAARIVYGQSVEELKKGGFGIFNSVLEGYLKQLKSFFSVIVELTASIQSLIGFINGLANIGSATSSFVSGSVDASIGLSGFEGLFRLISDSGAKSIRDESSASLSTNLGG